jgi:hypothetical protein
MAIAWSEVKKAFYVFRDIIKVGNENIRSSFIQERDEKNQFDENYILGIDPKQDSGWENVFINVRGITKEQMELWEYRKTEVNNSSFCHEVQPGLTRIGFY